MKKLGVYNYEGEHGECTLFFEGEDLTKLIRIVDGNDADWRHEYFNPILKKFGIEVVRMKISQEDVDDIVGDWYK